MELRQRGGVTIVVRCADGLDTTARLRGACLEIVRDVLARGVRGAVVKSGSPSCAAGGALLFPEHGGSPRPDGTGFLVQALHGLAPALPVIDEAAFEDAGRRAAFFRQMSA
jgi:uncharacterized protein YbbK (DUF523 family)